VQSDRLNAHRRVADHSAVEAALKGGEAVRTPFFRMLYRAGQGPPGVAFLAGRRVGGAVRRNRAKRVLREAYRTSGIALPCVETLVLVASERAASAPYGEVKAALDAALEKASGRTTSRGNGKAATAA
jgi:ribonuclease P protein component